MDLKKKVLSISKDIFRETAKISLETMSATARHYSKEKGLSEDQREKYAEIASSMKQWGDKLNNHVALFGGCFYFALPFPIQLIIFAINAIVPDPIPYVDEIIMVGGIISKISFLDNVGYFISEHKILSIIIAIPLSIFLIWGSVQIWNWIF